MKRTLIALGLILIMAVSAGAQDLATGLTGKGIKFGLSMANNKGDFAEGMDSKIGFAGGAFLTYNFTPMFAVQPEILYVMKGSKFEESLGTIGLEAKVKIDYLEIPILLKVTPQMQGNVKPNFFAGPSIGLLMSAKQEATISGIGDDVSEEIDIKDAMKSLDLGISFGAGVDIKMEAFTITFDARYTLGMTKLVDYEEWNELYEYEEGDDDYLTEDPDIKNTCFAFMLGVSF